MQASSCSTTPGEPWLRLGELGSAKDGSSGCLVGAHRDRVQRFPRAFQAAAFSCHSLFNHWPYQRGSITFAGTLSGGGLLVDAQGTAGGDGCPLEVLGACWRRWALCPWPRVQPSAAVWHLSAAAFSLTEERLVRPRSNFIKKFDKIKLSFTRSHRRCSLEML